MSFRKVRWILIAVMLFGVLLSACSPSDPQFTPSATHQVTKQPSATPLQTKIPSTPEPTSTSEPIVQGDVDIWLDWAPSELVVLETHLAEFQEKFPEIQLSISYFPPEELRDRYIQAAEVGQEPTILFGPSEWTKPLSQAGTIRDVFGRTTQEFLDSLQTIALEGVTRSPFILGLPFSLEGIVLYRNKGLVQESPQTLDQLVSAAKNLEGDEYFGSMLDVGFLYTGSFLHTCDGEFLDANNQLLFTVEAGQCWLEMLNTWRQSGSIVQNSERDLESFLTGQTAWLVDGTWNAPRILETLGPDQIAIDPWPIYSAVDKPLTGYAWGKNIYFGVSSSEESFNAAWIFARYLLTPEVQLDFSESTLGLHVPVLKSIPTVQPWLQELITSMASNISFPQFPQLNIFIEHLEVAAFDVSRRGYDPYYAILWAHPKIEKALRFVDFEQD